MTQSIISLKVDTKDKEEATKVAQDLGIPLATYLKMCLKRLKNEKQILFQRLEVPKKSVAQLWKKQSKDISQEKNLSPSFSSLDSFKSDLLS